VGIVDQAVEDSVSMPLGAVIMPIVTDLVLRGELIQLYKDCLKP
jgi:hypothetical protein